MKQYDLVILGAGPAGLAAAIYAARARLETVVLDRSPMSGGQIVNTYDVDNYPGLPGLSGAELALRLREHADALGAVFQTETVQAVRPGLVSGEKAEYPTRAILVATGASYRTLGVPGEERLRGRGVSYCATCDAMFFRNKTVAVVGGGDTAAKDAIFLARQCEKVYLIHRRDRLRATKILDERLRELPNVEILWNSQITRIEGENVVTSVVVGDHPLPVQGVFIAVGIQPNNALVQGVLALDAAGFVLADEDGRTSVPGIFVAGDLRAKALRQIVTAAADGANAVFAIEQYLESVAK